MTFVFFILMFFSIEAHCKNTKGKTVVQTGDTINLQLFTKDKETGLFYKIEQNGTGSKPYPGETVTVHYTGWTLHNNLVGQKFDSSLDRNQEFSFILGQGMVIRGWEISLADMKIGEKRLVLLPPDLAYGEHGTGNVIEPHATLLFEIDLIKAA